MLLALGMLHAGSLRCKPHDRQKKLNANAIMITYSIKEACIKCLLFDKPLGLSLPGNWYLRFQMGYVAWSLSAAPIIAINDHPQRPPNNATMPSKAHTSGELKLSFLCLCCVLHGFSVLHAIGFFLAQVISHLPYYITAIAYRREAPGRPHWYFLICSDDGRSGSAASIANNHLRANGRATHPFSPSE